VFCRRAESGSARTQPGQDPNRTTQRMQTGPASNRCQPRGPPGSTCTTAVPRFLVRPNGRQPRPPSDYLHTSRSNSASSPTPSPRPTTLESHPLPCPRQAPMTAKGQRGEVVERPDVISYEGSRYCFPL
jgi:hypothetical protein